MQTPRQFMVQVGGEEAAWHYDDATGAVQVEVGRTDMGAITLEVVF